jgi:hypothetical protein
MANTLSKTNIAQGNTIQPADVSQSVDAFTGVAAYDITVSGSFTFTGATTGSGWFSKAVSSSYALSSSYAVSSSRAISSSYALSSSYAISSSYATTASYALNGGGASYPLPTYINNATNGTIGTAYQINATSKGMLYIDTDGNTKEVYFEFNAGVSDQIITFTTYWGQSSSNLTPSSIYLKAAASNIYGLKSNQISGTTSRLSDLLLTSSPAITLVYSFQFQYTTVNGTLGWYLINISAG